MSYERQLHYVRVTIGRGEATGLDKKLRDAFEERYKALYGSAAVLGNAGIRLLTIGVDAVGAIVKPDLPTHELAGKDASAALTGQRDVFWPEKRAWARTDIYDGSLLRPGNQLEGPAILEQPGTTVVVPEGAVAVVDRFGNNVITLGGSTTA